MREAAAAGGGPEAAAAALAAVVAGSAFETHARLTGGGKGGGGGKRRRGGPRVKEGSFWQALPISPYISLHLPMSPYQGGLLLAGGPHRVAGWIT